MATKEKKAPKVVEVNQAIQNSYSDLIESGESANLEAINFIVELAEKMNAGLTEEVAKNSMKQVLKDVNVKPVVLPSHISAIKTASLIIKQFEAECSDIKASKVLSLATRVNCDVKAPNAQKHIESVKSFEELDQATLTKKASQERDNQKTRERTIKSTAKNLTIESVVDSLDDFLSAISLKDAKTTQPKKLDSVIARLYTISKNSKVSEKVSA